MSGQSAPAANASPASTAPATETAAAAPDSPAQESGAPAGTPTAKPATEQLVTVNGRPYTLAEIQAALETETNLGKRLGELTAKEAAIAGFQDPAKLIDTLKQFGHDPDEFALQRVLKLKEMDEMDPKDRELAEYKAKAEAYEREQAEAKRKAEEAKQAELNSRLRQQTEERIVQSAAKHGLPKTRQAFDAVLAMMEDAAAHNLQLPEDVAVQLVKQDMTDSLNNYVQAMEPAALLKLLPKPMQQELLKQLTEQALAPSRKDPDARRPGASVPNEKPEWLKKMLEF